MSRFDRRAFKSGMIVKSAEGALQGTIAVCGDERLYLRKSAFSHHRFGVKYAQVDRIEGGVLFLKAGQGQLEDLGSGALPEKAVTYTKPFYPPAFFEGSD
jgi:hypothetical protein